MQKRVDGHEAHSTVQIGKHLVDNTSHRLKSGIRMDDTAMKTCLAWVPRGRPAQRPTSWVRCSEGQEVLKSMAESRESESGVPVDVPGMQFMHVTDETIAGQDGMSDDDEDEVAAQEIRSTDSALVVGSANPEISELEVYVYDSSSQGFYVHHDYILGAFPLCTEWISSWNGSDRNLAVVGSFEPIVEIWDLDVTENLVPAVSLGLDPSYDHYAKSTARPTSTADAHEDAVLCLSAHPSAHVLATGSADHTIKLWSLGGGPSGSLVNTLRLHQEKVQSLLWHPRETKLLASAGYDRCVVISDADSGTVGCKTSLSTDIESILWSKSGDHLYVCSEDGSVRLFDPRNMSTPVWELALSKKSITSMCLPYEGLLVTSCYDGTARVVDTRNQPTVVHEKELHVGPLHCVRSNPDVPYYLAFGGESAVVWDLEEAEHVHKIFGWQSLE